MMDLDSERQVPYDAIDSVVRGASLLKFGRHGNPHYSEIKVSEDYRSLSWTSKRKSFGESTVLLSSVDKVLVGQQTAVFKKNERKDLEKTSFSLVVRGVRQRSLDLACKDEWEFKTWTVALDYLIKQGAPPPLKVTVDTASSPSFMPSPIMVSPAASMVNDDVTINGLGGTPEEKTPVESSNQNEMMLSPGSRRSRKQAELDRIKQLRESFKDANDVYVVGFNGWGQLGLETDQDVRGQPVLLKSLLKHTIQMVACGFEHSLALSKSGEVYSWGHGGSGRLGLGHCAHMTRPTLVPVKDDVKFKFVACGDMHSLAICAVANRIYAWGANARGQLGLGGNKGNHDCYDDNESNKMDRCSPCPIPSFSEVDIVSIGGGHEFSACIDALGNLYTWGAGDSGCLGHGAYKDESAPRQVNNESLGTVRMMALGRFHMAAVSVEQGVHTWGFGETGALGHGNFISIHTPKPVQMFHKNYIIKALSCGTATTAVIAADPISKGTPNIYMFGSIGNQEPSAEPSLSSAYLVPVPTMISQLQGESIRMIVCGHFCNVALSDSSKLYVWGQEMEALGKEPSCTILDPMMFDSEGLQDKLIRSVVCGGRHCCIVVAKEWIKDSEATNCMICQAEFTMLRRRHHCRRCGCIACSNCTSRKRALLHLGYVEPVRVCDYCYSNE